MTNHFFIQVTVADPNGGPDFVLKGPTQDAASSMIAYELCAESTRNLNVFVERIDMSKTGFMQTHSRFGDLL